MGEYIKYKGEHIKIGTCESLYYTTFQKYLEAYNAGMLKGLAGNGTPREYLQPDVFRFRFPFPDEDHFQLGDIGKAAYDRAVLVKVSPSFMRDSLRIDSVDMSKEYSLGITQQKLVHRENDGKLILAIVVRDPVSKESMRIEDERCIQMLAKEIVRNHILNETDPKQKNFFRLIASRMLKGYRADLSIESPKKQVTVKVNRPRKGL